MQILVGLLLALPGGLAVLAGLSGMHRVRRLRREGVAAWAVTVTLPGPSDDRSDGSARQQVLQYTLADGRVLEHVARAPARRPGSPGGSRKVLVWYDPEDPSDVLVYGRWGRFADRAFVAAGALFILIGAGLALFGR
jgi:uncharacterized protein DUF3592